MATLQFNFTERTLDQWVRQILDQWSAQPALIPDTGEGWAADRGGPGSVPGLHIRLRLRKTGNAWTTQDPAIGFYLMKRIEGRKLTRLLGDRQVLSVERARAEAQELLKKLHQGEDPKETQRKVAEVRQLQALTYRQALERFLQDSPALTEGTRKKYRMSLTTTFKDVADKPLTTLTQQRVRTIHEQRSLESKSRADQDMRVLRLLWNWAKDNHQTEGGEPVLGPNPVSLALNKKRAGRVGWNRVPRKETIIPRAKLPEWFAALRQVHSTDSSSEARRVSCLLLEALALTGLRFNELATLPWSRVDLGMGILTIPDTSSKNRRTLVRPLTRRVRQILQEVGTKEGYLFPGRVAGQPLDNTRKLQLELQARTGLWITPHDLRRVYTSAATRARLPEVVTKRLLNHMTNAEEVTEGYIRFGLDELLEYSQAVEDEILGDAGLLASPSLEAQLQSLLSGMLEADKQRLLFELEQRQTREAW